MTQLGWPDPARPSPVRPVSSLRSGRGGPAGRRGSHRSGRVPETATLHRPATLRPEYWWGTIDGPVASRRDRPLADRSVRRAATAVRLPSDSGALTARQAQAPPDLRFQERPAPGPALNKHLHVAPVADGAAAAPSAATVTASGRGRLHSRPAGSRLNTVTASDHARPRCQAVTGFGHRLTRHCVMRRRRACLPARCW